MEHAVSEGYPAELRSRLFEAVAFLRVELGEFDAGMDSKSDDRLWNLKLNAAPWTRHWLVWLADCLRRICAAPSYDRLRRRLRQPARFSEALDVVEVAEVCQLAGLELEFDPDIVVERGPRQPDIVVAPPGSTERVFIEVTTLHDPKAMREATHIMMMAAPELMKPPLRLAGRCLRTLTPESLPLLLRIAEDVAHQARHEASLKSARVPNFVELAYAPEAQIDRLESWARARGIEPLSFEWPEVETKEARRVSTCLRDKCRQVPSERPGVIVINNPRVRSGEEIGRDELGDRLAVRDTLRNFPHMVCCVFCAGNIAVANPTTEGVVRPRWSTVGSRMPFELWRTEYEFIWNDSYALSRPRAIMRRIYREFLERHRYWQRRGVPASIPMLPTDVERQRVQESSVRTAT